MRKVIGTMLMGVLLTGLGIGIPGCSEESGVKKEVTIKAPDGSKTVETQETKVKQSGDNPPAPPKTP
ncbi:MAG: hypothetical protein ACLQGP_14515 [Isosphaeraceae bacterium]